MQIAPTYTMCSSIKHGILTHSFCRCFFLRLHRFFWSSGLIDE